MNLANVFKKAMPSTQVRELWRLLLLCALVGVVSGLGAIAFYTLLDLSRWVFSEYLIGITTQLPGGEPALFEHLHRVFQPWLLFVIPTAGGLLCGILVYSLAPEAEGHGTDAAIDAYHNHEGKIRARVPFVKALVSAITIGTGGSAGREGPIAQIGAGFGSVFANWLRLRPHEKRVLMAAGMSAGVGAIFHAPLAGALFGAEVLYKELDLEYEVIIPAVISSIVAYAIFAMRFGWDPLFQTPDFVFRNPAELLPYSILAVVVGAGAILFVKFFYSIRDLFVQLRLPNHVKPAIGGLVIGCIAFFLPETLGAGYGIVQKALFEELSAGLLILIGLMKIVTTSFTIASGGSGGVFGPAIVIGGALGGGVGILMAQLFPGMELHPGAFALVGMAGFFAAAANTPLSTIIMVSEMTGNYHLLVPSMWVCVVGFILCKRYTIYEAQIGSRFDAPVHTGNMLKAVLGRISVADAVKGKKHDQLMVVQEDTYLSSLAEKYFIADHNSLPVVDDQGDLIGMISGRDLRTVLGQNELEHLIVAADLVQAPITVKPDDDLFRVVGLMESHRVEELIVVSEESLEKPVVTISRNDVVSAYQEALESARSDRSHPSDSA